MGRSMLLGQWVLDGLCCLSGTVFADEPAQAPPPRPVERAELTTPALPPVVVAPLPPVPNIASPVPQPAPSPPVIQPKASPSPVASGPQPTAQPALKQPALKQPLTQPASTQPIASQPPAKLPSLARPVATQPVGGAQPANKLPSPMPPRDTTRDPIDRVLEPTKPSFPSLDPQEVAASYANFPPIGFAGPSSV